MVATNPPFGKKSSITIVKEGDTDLQSLTYNRPDVRTTTSNKQLNFVQHVKALLNVHGSAAVVVPDNVLFEGGADRGCARRPGAAGWRRGDRLAVVARRHVRPERSPRPGAGEGQV